jgi:RNA polymerase sigma-70 factor (ECF subfamily)
MTTTPEADWLDQWVLGWGDAIVRYAFVLTADYHAAQDIAQDTFVRLHQFHERHPDRAVVPGWLYTTARRLCFTTNRRQARWISLVGHEPTSGDESVWVGPAFREMISQLGVLDRECVWLFYYCDWTTDEIARHVGRPASTIRGRLMRARQHLREMWGDSDG